MAHYFAGILLVNIFIESYKCLSMIYNAFVNELLLIN